MYCEKCGKELDKSSLVCGYCGQAIPLQNLDEETLSNLKKNQKHIVKLKNICYIFNIRRIKKYE